jgi:hypothetical protein
VDFGSLAFQHETPERFTIHEQIIFGNDEMMGLAILLQGADVGLIENQAAQASRAPCCRQQPGLR